MPLNENKRIRISPQEFTDRTGTDTAKVTDWENWEKELALSSSSPTPPPQHHSASCFQSKMGLFSWLTSTILPKLLNNSIFGRSYYTSRLCKQNTDIPWGTVVAFPYTNSAFNWLRSESTNRDWKSVQLQCSRTVNADCWNRHKPQQFLDGQNEKNTGKPKGASDFHQSTYLSYITGTTAIALQESSSECHFVSLTPS